MAQELKKGYRSGAAAGNRQLYFFDENGKRINTDKMFLVIAEKPGVSLAIAHVLGKYEKMNGYVQGKGFICSWCLGHLAEYAVPEAYDSRYRNWRLEDLPIIPQEWKVEVIKERMKQFRVLEGLLNRRDVEKPKINLRYR